MKLSIFVLLLTVISSASINVPLKVDNWASTSQTSEPVTAGIPLPMGSVTNLFSLRIVDASGNRVPAQFKSLSKWWIEKNKNNIQNPSTKWVLCDFQTSISATGSSNFTLKDDNTSPTSTSSLIIDTTATTVTITTGPLKFTISKTHFNLFDELWLDKDSNGTFDISEKLISSSQNNGGFITAGSWTAAECIDGTVHSSSLLPPDKVVVEEKGPMKVVLRIEGKHYAAANGVNRGLYGYQVFITAYADKPFVDVQWGVTNYHIGIVNGWASEYYVWPFKQYNLTFNINLGATQTYKLLGESTELSGSASNIPVRLLQKRGSYSVTGSSGGTYSMGGVALSDSSTSVQIAVKDFAPRNPGALKVENGKITLELFPDTGATESNKQYWLDSRSRKNTRMRIAFSKRAAQNNELINLSKIVNAPLRMLAPAEWYQSTRAYYRGAYAIPFDNRFKQRVSNSNWSRFAKNVIDDPQTQSMYNTSIADWRNYGYHTVFNDGGDHYGFTSAFWKYVLTGNPVDFEKNEAMVMYFNDLVPVQTDPAKMWDTWAISIDEPTIVRNSSWLSPPINFDFETLNRFPGGAEWNRPNADRPDAGHMTQLELLEYYQLTGDYPTKDAMEGLALEAARYLYCIVDHNNFGIWKTGEHPGIAVPLDSAFLVVNSYGPRYIARPSIVCAHAYEVTGDERYMRPLTLGAYGVRNTIKRHPTGYCAIDGNAFQYQNKADSIWAATKPGDSIAPLSYATSFFQHSIGLEALYSYLSLTGDKEVRDALTLGGNFLKTYAGKAGSSYTGWSYVYFDYYEAGKRSDSVTAGSQYLGFTSSSYESVGGISSAYLGTGRPEFFKIIQDAKTTCDIVGYYPDKFDLKIFSMFESYYKHDSLDAVPPAAVTNLTCDTSSGRSVLLSWTAPGDNGTTGQASEYRIKFSTVPIVDAASRWNPGTRTGWPDLNRPTPYTRSELIARTVEYTQSKEISFWAAKPFNHMLSPKTAGNTETFNIDTMLTPNTRYYFALVAYDAAGNVSEISNVVSCTTPATIASEKVTSTFAPFTFYGNHPNPFNPVTTTSFYTNKKTEVSLKIFDTQGRLVRTLFSGSAIKGLHKINWNGTNNRGIAVASGLYLCRIESSGFIKEERMMLVR